MFDLTLNTCLDQPRSSLNTLNLVFFNGAPPLLLLVYIVHCFDVLNQYDTYIAKS
jgi:hypothetical protein